jgi:hypothetical protein
MICADRTSEWRILIGKPEAKKQLRKPGHRWEKMLK